MLYTVKLVIEYDGSAFHGWQNQVGERTIQSELERVLPVILREPIRNFTAAGRTDAGVHAKGQVVSFRVTNEPDLYKIQRAVSALLSPEISVVSAELVDNSFHATLSAHSKRYKYTILNRVAPPALDFYRVWWVSAKLDIERMCSEAKKLLGEHDFKSFEGPKSQVKSTVRTITRSDIIIDEPYIYYVVEGNGFIKQMVRNIVGTLVDFGKGRAKRDSILEILDAKDRQVAGPTAPPQGLCLEEVYYD